MSDSVDSILNLNEPFEGSETDPYTVLRVGRVVKVYASAEDVTDQDTADTLVGTLKVEWLDRTTPSDQVVPWSFPSFSNPLVSTTQEATNLSTTPSQETSQTAVGGSSGIFFVPSEGDLVICGFRNPANPVVLGFLPHNLNKQQLTTAEKTAAGLLSFGPFRTLRSGEYAIRSKQQAELYLDRAGSIQLVVMSQPSGSGTPPISTATVPATELARISLGVTYDQTFTSPTQTAEGRNVACNITFASGAKIQVDVDGNINVQAAPTKTVNLNSGTNGVARLTDATLSNNSTDSAFWTFMSNLVTTFNTHVHSVPGVTTGGGTTTSVIPTVPMSSAPTAQIGKINSASSTVKAGD